MNPALIGIPLALFGAIMLFARPAHAPAADKRQALPADLHIASPIVTKRLSGAYPDIVAALSRKWSKVFSVPVAWLRSQAYAESKNVPTALNEITGAVGVLQIMPNTAEWLVTSLLRTTFHKHPKVAETFKAGWTGDLTASLYNPDFNIMLAAYYLTILKRKFGDDHEIVAAAYDAGPSKIAAILDKGDPLPDRSKQYIAMVEDAKRRGFM
jgi:soluble lytic murein transglycosylase-like protein